MVRSEDAPAFGQDVRAVHYPRCGGERQDGRYVGGYACQGKSDLVPEDSHDGGLRWWVVAEEVNIGRDLFAHRRPIRSVSNYFPWQNPVPGIPQSGDTRHRLTNSGCAPRVPSVAVEWTSHARGYQNPIRPLAAVAGLAEDGIPDQARERSLASADRGCTRANTPKITARLRRCDISSGGGGVLHGRVTLGVQCCSRCTRSQEDGGSEKKGGRKDPAPSNQLHVATCKTLTLQRQCIPSASICFPAVLAGGRSGQTASERLKTSFSVLSRASEYSPKHGWSSPVGRTHSYRCVAACPTRRERHMPTSSLTSIGGAR